MSTPGTYPASQHPPSSFTPPPRAYLQGAPVGFREAVTEGLRNGLVLRGRASRSAFWWFVLFQGMAFALWMGISLPLAASKGNSAASAAGLAVGLVFGIPFLYLEVVTWTLFVRRLHDTDRSGWWWLIGFVPYVGAIVLLIFTMLKGTPGPNRYTDAEMIKPVKL
jgi:uncharacterized membrane protein YhaH (DUF805 family)